MENKLILTSHEFWLLCDDLESSSFDTCISLVHDENVKFVVDLMSCVKIETGINFHECECINFVLTLNLNQAEQLKKYIDWVYCESYDSYCHDEDKEGFLKLRNKIVDL